MNNRIIRKAIFILLPVTVWICFYCIFHDELSADVTPVFTLLISFASVLSIAGLFYLLYSITNDTLKDARQEAELLALNQQQKLKEQQNQTLASRRQQTLSLQENVQRDLHTYETLMDNGQYEEAAFMLGASRRKTFLAVILPELRPALLTGFGLAFARGIGEYGSVIYISGNSAKDKTQAISYVIMQKLGMIDYESATAIALLMLIISFVLLLFINIVQARQSARTNLL